MEETSQYILKMVLWASLRFWLILKNFARHKIFEILSNSLVPPYKSYSNTVILTWLPKRPPYLPLSLHWAGGPSLQGYPGYPRKQNKYNLHIEKLVYFTKQQRWDNKLSFFLQSANSLSQSTIANLQIS